MAGKALRKMVPRSAHAAWKPAPRRKDPLAILRAQNATRMAELVPVRMQRMAASPFAFLRGGAAIMAGDLARTPVSGLDVMACGDMHVSNFGVFASAERNLIFAINDFDEVHPGPLEWDLKRLAASAAIAVEFSGGTKDHSREAAEIVVRAYVRHMRRYAGMGAMEIWYDRIDQDAILAAVPRELAARTRRALNRARGRGHQRSFERLTERTDGHHRLIEEPPLIMRSAHMQDGTPALEALDGMLNDYMASLLPERVQLLRNYRIRDAVRKVVGVGSVGTGCWAILLEGANSEDPLFLQVKEARQSVLAPYVQTRFKFDNEGRRVVTGQRLIQGSPDIFLGWGHGLRRGAGDYYVRQLADMKGSLRINEGDRRAVPTLLVYCDLCGRALALAHAKSGDAAKISGYYGVGDALPEAIGQFAMLYAQQNGIDHDRLVAAMRSGSI